MTWEGIEIDWNSYDIGNDNDSDKAKLKKKKMFLVGISIKKRGAWAVFFVQYLLFPIVCFLYTLLPSPRDTLELLGQILIKRNIRYWLNTSLFNFDTHKGLTVKIYIILVCTQQQRALHIFDVIRTPS